MSKSPIDIINENRRWQIQKTVNDFDGKDLKEHIKEINRINDHYDELVDEYFTNKAKNYS